MVPIFQFRECSFVFFSCEHVGPIICLPLVLVSIDSQSSQLPLIFPTSDVKHRIRVLASAKLLRSVSSPLKAVERQADCAL